MTDRARIGPWVLVMLVLGIAAAAWWTLRSEPTRPMEVAGTSRELATTPKRREEPPPKLVVDARPSGEDERTKIVPAGSEMLDAPPPPPLELELHAPDGTPLAGAEVRAFDDSGLVDNAESDDAGVAKLRAGKGAGRVLVRGADFVPWIADADLTAGRRRLDEPARDILRGKARVDGAEPNVELEFELVSERTLFDTASFAPNVRTFLGLDGYDATRLQAKCDVHGDFVFRGLTDPFSGRIDVPRAYVVSAVVGPGAILERRAVRLTQLASEIAVDLLALPAVTGRIVESNGTAVAEARLSGWLAYANPDRSRSRTVSDFNGEAISDGEGRFRMLLDLPKGFGPGKLASAADLPPTERVGLTIDRGENAASVDIEIQAATMVSRWDVGDVVLAPARGFSVVIHDPAGKPIEGAIVLAGEARAKSDAEGRATIVHVSEADTASVGKLGFHPQDVPIGGEAPTEVVLQPTNVWTLAFVDATGAPIPRRRFVLTRPDVLFLGDDPTRPSRTHVESGGTNSESSFKLRDSGGVVTRFRCDNKGRAVLSDLASPFLLRIVDGLGRTLEERKITLGTTEVREEAVKLDSPGGAFAGRVVDELGASLAGAKVRLNLRSLRTSESELTDAAGEFRFEGLAPGKVALQVDRDGFSPIEIADYELVLDAEPAEFRLHAAHELLLEVVDDLGTEVPTDECKVRAPQNPELSVRRRKPNTFQLRDLPGESVTATLTIGGRAYEREVDPLAGDLRVVVPRQGRLIVVVAHQGEPPPGGEYRARVRSKDPSESVSVSAQIQPKRSPPTAFFDALLPGAYVVEVEWREHSDRDGHSARAIGSPIEVVVTTDANARAEFRD